MKLINYDIDKVIDQTLTKYAEAVIKVELERLFDEEIKRISTAYFQKK